MREQEGAGVQEPSISTGLWEASLLSSASSRLDAQDCRAWQSSPRDHGGVSGASSLWALRWDPCPRLVRKDRFAVGPEQALGPRWNLRAYGSPCPCCRDPGLPWLSPGHLAGFWPGTLSRYFPRKQPWSCISRLCVTDRKLGLSARIAGPRGTVGGHSCCREGSPGPDSCRSFQREPPRGSPRYTPRRKGLQRGRDPLPIRDSRLCLLWAWGGLPLWTHPQRSPGLRPTSLFPSPPWLQIDPVPPTNPYPGPGTAWGTSLLPFFCLCPSVSPGVSVSPSSLRLSFHLCVSPSVSVSAVASAHLPCALSLGTRCP